MSKKSVPVQLFKKREIEKMPFAEAGAEILLRDDGSPLRLRIGPKKKTFYVNDRNASGKLIKRNLPHDPNNFDLDELRADARAALAEKDLEIEFAKAGGKIRLLDALQLRYKVYGKRSATNPHGIKPSTIEHYELILRRYAEDWLDLDMRQISESMFETRYQSLRNLVHLKRIKGVAVLDENGQTIPMLDENGRVKQNKTSARHLRTYISTLYNFVREHRNDQTFANPTSILKRNKVKETIHRRKYVVNPEIAGKFIKAALKFRNERPQAGRKNNQSRECTNLILSNLFVGMRSGEFRRSPINMLVFSETGNPIGFDFDEEYAADVFKTIGRYTVAFSDVMRSIVADQYDPKNIYLFQSNIRVEPISDSSVRPYMSEICELAGIGHYPLNAMRNFFINLGERGGVTGVLMKHLVNHSTKSDMTDGYANLRNDFDFQLKSSQKITDFILQECGISKSEFGIKQEETNERTNALEILKKFDPEYLKHALAWHENNSK